MKTFYYKLKHKMKDLLNMKFKVMIWPILAMMLSQCGAQNPKDTTDNMEYKVEKTDSAWRAELSDEEYRVLRTKGTERPYSGEYETHWDSGTYVCKGCGAELFTSETKFDAGCGWPSFYEGIKSDAIKEIVDNSLGMSRTEVVCAACGGHLGHVFNDGYKQPTGLRYCINSVSLGFKKKEEE